jgi:hypothetical protein
MDFNAMLTFNFDINALISSLIRMFAKYSRF